MTREEASKYLKEMKDECNDTIHKVRYVTQEEALDMAIEALERKPYEKFESTKDHIYKLAGDYKCWDNRLTEDEAVELCHILEQEPSGDAISKQSVLNACEQSINILEAVDRIMDLPSVNPQEPFMNKPCVSHQVCHEDKVKVLDKIRAEIEPKCDRINSLASVLPYTAHREIQELLCEIMDLYKAKSEDKE